jgi:hypothetical protein
MAGAVLLLRNLWFQDWMPTRHHECRIFIALKGALEDVKEAPTTLVLLGNEVGFASFNSLSRRATNSDDALDLLEAALKW